MRDGGPVLVGTLFRSFWRHRRVRRVRVWVGAWSGALQGGPPDFLVWWEVLFFRMDTTDAAPQLGPALMILCLPPLSRNSFRNAAPQVLQQLQKLRCAGMRGAAARTHARGGISVRLKIVARRVSQKCRKSCRKTVAKLVGTVLQHFATNYCFINFDGKI